MDWCREGFSEDVTLIDVWIRAFRAEEKAKWSWVLGFDDRVINLFTHSLNKCCSAPSTRHGYSPGWRTFGTGPGQAEMLSNHWQLLMVSKFRNLSAPSFPGRLSWGRSLCSMAFFPQWRRLSCFHSGCKMIHTRGRKSRQVERGQYLYSHLLEGSMVNTLRVSFWMFLCTSRCALAHTGVHTCMHACLQMPTYAHMLALIHRHHTQKCTKACKHVCVHTRGDPCVRAHVCANTHVQTHAGTQGQD